MREREREREAPTRRTARSLAASPGLRSRGAPTSRPSRPSGTRSASVRRILSRPLPRDWAASLCHLFREKDNDEEVEEEWRSYRRTKDDTGAPRLRGPHGGGQGRAEVEEEGGELGGRRGRGGSLLVAARSSVLLSAAVVRPPSGPLDKGRRGNPTAAMGPRVLFVACGALWYRWLLCGHVLQVFPSTILKHRHK